MQCPENESRQPDLTCKADQRLVDDPEFKKFYEADKVSPKDEKLNFEDFKTVALTKYETATDEDL